MKPHNSGSTVQQAAKNVTHMILFQMGTLAKWWGPVHSHTLTTYSITTQRHLRNELSHNEFCVCTVELVGQNQMVPVLCCLVFELGLNTSQLTVFVALPRRGEHEKRKDALSAASCTKVTLIFFLSSLIFLVDRKKFSLCKLHFFSLSKSKNPYAICLTNMGLKKTLAH